jgi:dipeptidyl aminopeptidase/acylaminoacyl peptidase
VSRGPVIAPYGSWTSPITAERLARGSVGLGQIVLDGGDIYWSELRPAEGGRQVIVRFRDGAAQDMTPAGFSARTRVHEYGGGAFTVADGVIYFSHDGDQRLYRQAAGAAPAAITPEANRRYADIFVDRRRRRLLCVCEDHGAGAAPVNTLVSIDLAAPHAIRTLAAGNDFYAAPRLSPDGARLAWLAWNHPDMPWDGCELWLANIGADGAPENPRRIAGGRDESIFQPAFAPDGTLYFVSDRSGWWNLHRWRDGRVEALAPMAAEFGLPHWVFGMSTYAFASARQIACAFQSGGRWHTAVLDTDRRRLDRIETPYTDVSSLAAREGRVVFIGAAPTLAPAVVQWEPARGTHEILRRSLPDAPEAAYVSAPQALEYPTADGATAHAFYYPPRNPGFMGPADAKPPLLVLSHGGPTAATSSALNLKIQFWTSRGFAVLDVNYRGSTGYGRDYRRRLEGRWGVADVEDCIAGARHLVARGLADEKRLAIRGGSAGGYTTLCALTFHRVFRAGAVYYGVSDLETLATDTHKFEARYLDRLIGPYPARRDLYRERSPIHHIDRMSCPVIFFQGLDDKVVPPDQTEKMVAALRARGVPVAYVPFAGEAHGLRRAGNIRRTLEAELYFYSRLFGFTPADAVEPVAIDNL